MRLPWTLQEQARLDSSLTESADSFSKSHFDLAPDGAME